MSMLLTNLFPIPGGKTFIVEWKFCHPTITFFLPSRLEMVGDTMPAQASARLALSVQFIQSPPSLASFPPGTETGGFLSLTRYILMPKYFVRSFRGTRPTEWNDGGGA